MRSPAAERLLCTATVQGVLVGYRAWRDVEDITMILAMRAAANTTADPTRIFPAIAGAGFSLHDTVRVLFDITTDQPRSDAA